MTFKFLNFHVLNLAKPGKNTLKTSLYHQDLITYMKRKRAEYTLCYVTVLFTLR